MPLLLMTWHDNAPCKGLTHLFFTKLTKERAKAKAICQTCPHVKDCYDEAIELTKQHQLFGVWGNTSQQQRERIAGRKGFNWYNTKNW